MTGPATKDFSGATCAGDTQRRATRRGDARALPYANRSATAQRAGPLTVFACIHLHVKGREGFVFDTLNLNVE